MANSMQSKRQLTTKPRYICLFIDQIVIISKNAIKYTALSNDGCNVAASNNVESTQNIAWIERNNFSIKIQKSNIRLELNWKENQKGMQWSTNRFEYHERLWFQVFAVAEDIIEDNRFFIIFTSLCWVQLIENHESNYAGSTQSDIHQETPTKWLNTTKEIFNSEQIDLLLWIQILKLKFKKCKPKLMDILGVVQFEHANIVEMMTECSHRL